MTYVPNYDPTKKCLNCFSEKVYFEVADDLWLCDNCEDETTVVDVNYQKPVKTQAEIDKEAANLKRVMDARKKQYAIRDQAYADYKAGKISESEFYRLAYPDAIIVRL